MSIMETDNESVPPNCEGKAASDGVVWPNKEGTEPNVEAEEDPKSDVCAGVMDGPNKDGAGAAEGGVAKKEDEGAEVGVLRNEKPAPEEGFDVGTAADGCEAFEAPGVAELAINPATCVEGCVLVVEAGRCRVGWTLLAAASCFAVSLRSASRNGSWHSPLRRWSARYDVLIVSIYW